MSPYRLFLTSIIAALLMTSQGLAGSYPGYGYQPNELPDGYGTDLWGLGPDMNYQGLEFYSPYPRPDSLTDEEKFAVAGAKDSALGHSLRPWYWDVFDIVNTIYYNTGEVPAELTSEMIKTVFIGCDTDEMLIDRYRSPLTGEFPQLDVEYFSPGDVYMRLLTPDEIDYMTSTSEDHYDVLVRGMLENPGTGCEEPVFVHGGVWYMRVYGYNEVLHASVKYKWTKTDLSQY